MKSIQSVWLHLMFSCAFLLLYVGMASAIEPTSIKVCSLLEKGKYKQLDAMMEQLHKQYISDYTKEEASERAYDCFSRSNPSFEKRLNDWVAARPKSAFAYLARAHYFNSVGWATRGEKWASETREEQFSGMQLYFTRAASDIRHAIGINPRIIEAYTLMIRMSKAVSSINGKDYLDKALQINTYAFWPRMAHITNLLPRWGGSLSEMSRFIESVRPYFGKNPKLKALEGRLSIEFGDSEAWNENFEKVVSYYTEALKYGEVNLYLERRGNLLRKLKRFKEAINDYDRILTTNPYYADALAGRAFSYYMLNRASDAIKDAEAAIDLNPRDESAHWTKGIAHYVLCDYKPAIDSLERAKEINPSDPEYEQYAQIARSRMRAKDYCVNQGKAFDCKTIKCETK